MAPREDTIMRAAATYSERISKMRQRLVPIVAAALVLCAAIPAPLRSQAPARKGVRPAAALDRELSAAVDRGDVPGLVVIAGNRDRILYQGVFGKAEVGHGRPMTADAI